MNETTYSLMAEELKRWDGDKAKVLDVGSLDVNGNYRELITSRGWEYTGLDIEPGKNVDIVAKGPYCFGGAVARNFDIVISGSTMEHVKAIWLWVPELVSRLRLGGMLAIVTHWQFPEHRYPVDCWRIMPDGMRHLFNETGQLIDYHIQIANERDIVGSAFKLPF